MWQLAYLFVVAKVARTFVRSYLAVCEIGETLGEDCDDWNPLISRGLFGEACLGKGGLFGKRLGTVHACVLSLTSHEFTAA